MKEQPILTAEERRRQLQHVLGYSQHAASIKQHIDLEMRLLLARYDDLQRELVQVLEHLRVFGQDEERASERTRTLERLRAEEHTIRAKLEFAGELLRVDRTVIAACLSTITFHHVEHAESSFEHAYPMLQGYILGEDPLPFPQLGFFTKEEVEQLLGLDPEHRRRYCQLGSVAEHCAKIAS